MTALNEEQLLGRVRSAWADVLEADDPGALDPDRNFLESGGSSLLLIMLWEDLRELSAVPLRVSDLFQHATIRAQAALLAGSAAPAPAPAPQPAGATDRRTMLGRARRGLSAAPAAPVAPRADLAGQP
ncbi:acyl carrier protein [Actinoplanes sp. RD1]|uniref:acyl carrier protein n=1 Tax=Actinoplanes sp. RD1 TaxID=3064538 RepID=UPI0027425CB2|nr:acyl carrier protein [Actinoplanes sp. RD1]